MMLGESIGHIPGVWHFLLVGFIPKSCGGCRPIGLFTASYRLWGKLRRKELAAWENSIGNREFFWGGRQKGSEACVWDQALAAEYFRARGAEAASILTDLVKAYEFVRHRRLWQMCRATRFPLMIARWCIKAFAGPRVVKVQGGAVSEPIRISTSIVAGCAAATSLL